MTTCTSRLLFLLLLILGRAADATTNSSTSTTDPTILHWSGTLLNGVTGEAITNGQIQIWQTDRNGMYNHPQDNSFVLSEMDITFQYYGTATTDSDGAFLFQTYRPGLYTSRPITHIHVRVFVENSLVLTTQMYFADEDPSYPPSLVLEFFSADNGSGVGDVYMAQKNIVIDISNDSGGSTSTDFTPSQQAGPFYPVEDFFDLGPNLVLDDDAPTVQPTWPPGLPPTKSPTTMTSAAPNVLSLFFSMLTQFLSFLLTLL